MVWILIQQLQSPKYQNLTKLKEKPKENSNVSVEFLNLCYEVSSTSSLEL